VKALRGVYANRWVRYGLTLGLLALVLLKVRPQQIAGALSSVSPGALALGLALTVPFLYLKALRWRLMLEAAGIQAGFGEALFSLVGGMGLALVTPARLGEVVRAAYVRDPRKIKIGALVLIDKGFDVLVLALLSVAGAWVLVSPALGVVLAAATALGLVFVYRPQLPARVLQGAARRLPLADQIARALGALESLNRRSTTIFLGLTAASFAVVLVQFAVVLSSWKAPAADVVFLTFPLVILTNVLPVTVAGLGVREGAAVLLLRHYGVPPAHAALAAFLMFFMNTALPGIAGALLLPAASPARETVPRPDRP